jgi:hypothetical protein
MLSLMDVTISLWQLSACVIVNVVGGERAPVVGRLELYRTHVLLYRTYVLMVRPTKVRR